MPDTSRLIGITGTIGSGKTMVGNILLEEGVIVVDTDLIVHQLLTEDGSVKDAVVERFGKEIVDAHGNIDRNKLGALVFKGEQERQDLEKIVHPSVMEEVKRKVSQHPQETVAILVPLLYEAGIADFFSEIWAILCDEETLRQRLKSRSNMSEEEMTARLEAQWSQAKKAALAHKTIDNSGTISDTRAQVRVALHDD